MSSLLINNSISEDFLACRTCLSTERRLFSVHQYNISDAYKNLIGEEATPYDALPQYICNYCSTLLIKYNIFKRNIKQAQNYFQDAKIIPNNLLSAHHPLSLSKTNIKIIDTSQKEPNVIKIGDNLRNSDNPHIVLYTEKSPKNANLNTYTDEYKFDTKNENDNLKNDNDIFENENDNCVIRRNGTDNCLNNDDKHKKGSEIYRNENDNSNNYKYYFNYRNNNTQHEIHEDNDTNSNDNTEIFKNDIDNYPNKDTKLKNENDKSDNYKNDIDKYQRNNTIHKNDNDNDQNTKCKLRNDIDNFRNEHDNFKIDNDKTHNRQKTTETYTKSKYFETDSNLKEFERNFNVKVLILSLEEQIKDVQDRKLSNNYIQSPYKCEFCFKGVMDEESLKKHILHQHDPSRGGIICDLCHYRYKDKRGLNQHLKNSHRIKFACKQCPYISRTTFNAKEHFKMHTGHLHYCRHCGKSYEKLSSHLSHLRIHHPSDFIWCDICGEAFIGQFGLNAHKKRAHRHLYLPFDCTSCDAKFTTDNALKKHKKYNNCLFQPCVHCGESFDKRMALRKHILENHKCLKKYNCEKCNKIFSRQSLFSAHYKRSHVDIKNKEKIKTHGYVKFAVKYYRCVLLYHQRNHSGEKPFQCNQCTKSFTMKRLLQSHLRVHSSDRPYCCKLCPKTFKGLSALRSHENIHTDVQKPSKRRQS